MPLPVAIAQLLLRVPPGYTVVRYAGKRWGMRRRDFNEGRSTKVYAEALDGSDFISCNYYATQSGGQFKPCEMAPEKVRAFLAGFAPLIE